MSSGYINLPTSGALGLTASELPTNIPATYIGDGTVSTTAFQTLAGSSTNLVTALAAKQPLLTSALGVSVGTLTVAGAVVAPLLGASVTGTTLVVDVSGNVRPLLSTRDAKENLRPLSMDPRVLLTLPTYSYNYIGSDAVEDVTHGFIAEEVAEVAPDLVIFKDGKPYSLQHVEFLAPMLELIKAQEARISDLETKLAEVKSCTCPPRAVRVQPEPLVTISLVQRMKHFFTGRF
jgi:hypothetical protein